MCWVHGLRAAYLAARTAPAHSLRLPRQPLPSGTTGVLLQEKAEAEPASSAVSARSSFVIVVEARATTERGSATRKFLDTTRGPEA